MQFRGGQHQRSHGQTLVVACRFWYELTDGYCGQFSLTMFPHQYARELLLGITRHLHCMQNFAGALEYLGSWRNGANGTIRTQTGMCFRVDALPLLVDERGRLYNIGGATEGETAVPVIASGPPLHVDVAHNLRKVCRVCRESAVSWPESGPAPVGCQLG